MNKSYAAAAATADVADAGGPPWRTVRSTSNRNNKRKLSVISPYKIGTCVTETPRIAAKKPDYLSNKCVVISGIDKSTTVQDLQSYVNEIAERDITFLHVEPLNYPTSWWRTLAIELSDDDYQVLNNPEIWEAGLKIRDFKGWKFWRQNRRRNFNRI